MTGATCRSEQRFCRSEGSETWRELRDQSRRIDLDDGLHRVAGCGASGKVSTTEEATRGLATHTFEWKDETSVRYGVPAIRNRISFDSGARRCPVSTRFQNEGKFRSVIDDEVIVRAAASHVELTCGHGSHRFVVRSAETLDVYFSSGKPAALASASRI